MLDRWFQAIKAMSIFVVCAQTLIQFKPKGAYEKYIRLLVSLILLVQLLEPVGDMLGILRSGELQQRILNMDRMLTHMQEQSAQLELETEDIWELLIRREMAGEQAVGE